MESRVDRPGGIRRDTLANQVAASLMRSIVDQGLRPGDPLPSEMGLSTRYHISRSVAREALRHLAALRMIQLTNGKVPVVSPVTGELLSIHFDWALQLEASSFLELHELRRAVEDTGGHHAAERRTADDATELGDLISRTEAEDDLAPFVDLDIALHVAVARASHNRLLLQTVESMAHALGGFVRTRIESMGRRPDADPPLVRPRRGHRRIVEPIRAGDAEPVGARMDEHLRSAVSTYVAAGPLEANR